MDPSKQTVSREQERVGLDMSGSGIGQIISRGQGHTEPQKGELGSRFGPSEVVRHMKIPGVL